MELGERRTAFPTWSLVATLVFALVLHGAEKTDKFTEIPACPALAAEAKRNHIPVQGLAAGSGTHGLRPGDSTTVLITFVQKKKQTQWLLYLEALARDPAKATNKPVTLTVNSAFGAPIKFRSKPYPVKLRMFGPYAVGGPAKQAKAKETVAQFSVNEDFLALGLDEPAALLYRWGQVTNFNLSKGLNSKALKAMNPTPAEQRTLGAVFPALVSYFEIVQHTEGLEDLLRKLIELPSVWSIIKHRGVQMNLTFGDGAPPSPAKATDWHLEPTASAHYFPWMMRLNGEPGLKFTLVTTSPRPPLLLAGGVVCVLAEKIDDEETYMTLRLISAKAGSKQK